MINRTQILSQIKNAVTSVDAGAEVILFGSQARGDYDEESDWDVMIVTDKAVDRVFTDNIIDVMIDLQIELKQVVNYIIRSKEDWKKYNNKVPLFMNIKEEGVLL